MLGIKPIDVEGSYFTLTLAPGETRTLTVELANYGTAKARARTYASDAYSIINGGFGAKLDGEATSGTTTWLDYPADTLDLEPRTGTRRTSTVRVPPDATPGEYITSLAIQSAESQPANSTGVAIRQVLRQAIAVAIRIPGPQTPSVVIGAATYRTIAGTSLIAVSVKNTGNVHLKPTGDFVLRDANGTEISRYPIAMDSVYAGTSTFIEVPFAGRLNPGDYTVALALADSTQDVQVSTQKVALIVPLPETEGAPAAIGVVPAPAAINQAPSAPAGEGSQRTSLLIGGCLAIVLALLSMYVYRRKRRAHA